jgi:hypothetical protein
MQSADNPGAPTSSVSQQIGHFIKLLDARGANDLNISNKALIIT